MHNLQVYIDNIIRQAKLCENITRIVRMTPMPDIDDIDTPLIAIAVFGKIKQLAYLRSKEFRSFQRGLFAPDIFFDVLYFAENDAVPEHIRNGEVVYVKKDYIIP